MRETFNELLCIKTWVEIVCCALIASGVPLGTLAIVRLFQ
jgi:hypothetical protein